MTGATHATVGVVTLGCVCYLHPNGFTIHNQTIVPQIALLTAAAGSLLPDIDIQQSKMGQKFWFSKFLKHRGFTHTLVIPAIILLLLVGSVYLPDSVKSVFNIAVLAFCAVSAGLIGYSIYKKKSVSIKSAITGGVSIFTVFFVISNMRSSSVLASLLFGLFFGWILHIGADLCNKKGIALIPGMSHIHIMCVLTRSWQETVWLAAYVLLVVGFTLRGVLLTYI